LAILNSPLEECCNLLLKGGHAEGSESVDILYAGDQVWEFADTREGAYAKHGSGCVLSAAITALLTKGCSLPEACRQAKVYTLAFLKSSETLIGHHYNINEYAG
jgi:hydroxymethylpyrimidine/phosphomethylpyrimidine kinase